MNEAVKIVVTGPESTGKTDLSRSLAGYFGTDFIPEYARSYVEALDRPYSYEDVEHIAMYQRNDLKERIKQGNKIIILDTYLVITKIWFMEIYGRCPAWIDDCLEESGIDLFLLCYYDLEWIEDPVRENPGQRREYLFDKYKLEIEKLGIPCELVKGSGQLRFQKAVEALTRHFPEIMNI